MDRGMDVSELRIPGALLIVPRVFSDARGYFKETFAASKYAPHRIDAAFVQDNVSVSASMTLRGLHGDPRMAKLVQVLRGSAFDVIVDLRKDSQAFGRWEAVALTDANHRQVYIPTGCLHGFLALEDDTILMYKQTAEYDPAREVGIAWNDPDLAIDWPLNGRKPLLSAKDVKNPTLRELGYL